MTFSIAPKLPTGAYVESQPSSSNMSASYLLSAPTAWMQNTEGQVYPVYTTQDMQLSEGAGLPCTLCGGGVVETGYFLIVGPVLWLPVPGSSRSTARIPAFSTLPVAKTQDLSVLPTNIVGNQRANLLVNPAGFADFTGTGKFTPYWLST